MQEPPLILTLRMDEESQAFFNGQRKLYFPPERNFLDAHLLLFHQLPNKTTTFDFFAGFTHTPLTLKVTGLMNLGAGVAYRTESQALNLMHQQLSRHFSDALIPQDRQGFRPHVTIMNKTTPEAARALIAQLSGHFEQFQIRAIGLDLWAYLGGPWRLEQHFSFS